MGDGLLEIAAHSHGELRQTIARRNRRQMSEMF